MRYSVSLVYDPDYRGYVAEVPGLPGCMSQGKTIEKALENIREAISLYLKETRTTPAKAQPQVIMAQVEV